MLSRLNEHRIEFKKIFFELLGGIAPGTNIPDASLMDTCSKRGLHLSFSAIQGCVRELERKIGETYKIRLQRVRGEGYIVLDTRDHANLWADETGKKLKRTIKRQSKRAQYVDVAKLPEGEQGTFVNRKMCLDSLAHITSGTVSISRVTKNEVAVLDTAACQLKALEAFKKAGVA